MSVRDYGAFPAFNPDEPWFEVWEKGARTKARNINAAEPAEAARTWALVTLERADDYSTLFFDVCAWDPKTEITSAFDVEIELMPRALVQERAMARSALPTTRITGLQGTGPRGDDP